jgi:hypothetical protein
MFYGEYSGIRDRYEPFQTQALLHHYAKAGMLVVQNMDWIEEQYQTWRDHSDPVTRRELNRQQVNQQQARKPKRSMEDWIEKLRTRPPRWLAGCAGSVKTALPAKLAGEFHSGCVHFSVVPPEGKPAVTLYGAATGDPVLVGSPVLIGSPKRERAVAVFDQMEDGYDAAVVAEEDRPPRQARRVRQFRCPSCEGRFFQVRVVLEYSGLDELEEAERERAEEFFSWVWVVAACAGCGWVGVATDVECA